MNTVKDCAEIYQNLLNKKYIFTLEGKFSFVLEFDPAYFYHIMGLEKLKDIVQFKGKRQNQIFKMILNGDISHKVIKNSRYYYLIKDRVENFDKILDLLNFDKSNKIIIDFDVNKLSFKSKLTFTRYILFKWYDNQCIHLTVGSKEKLYPETFIVEYSGQYISEQNMLDILNIEVIDR